MVCKFHKVSAVFIKLYALYFNSYIYAWKRSKNSGWIWQCQCSSSGWVNQTCFTPANASSAVNDGCHRIFSSYGVVKLHKALREEHHVVMSPTWPWVIMSSCTTMIDTKHSWDSNQKLIIFTNTGLNNKHVHYVIYCMTRLVRKLRFQYYFWCLFMFESSSA